MTLSDFPAINATLNGISACLIISGGIFISRNRKREHVLCMAGACVTSSLFLICYLYYHYHHGSTKYQGEGFLRTVYFSILLSHTVLAVVILPMVIRTVYLAVSQQLEKHKRIAKITLPIWIYVSITGVVIYWMLYRL